MTPTPPTPIRAWMRLSPSLIPLLAVLTAFMIGIPLMMLTENSVSGGLRTAGAAYSALIEGMFGVAINDVATLDNFSEVTDYVTTVELSKDGLTRQARPIERVEAIGADNIKIYEVLFAKYPDVTDEELEIIGPAINPMRDIGIERVRATGEIIARLDAYGLSRSQVKSLTTLVARKSSLSTEERAAAAAIWSPIGTMDDSTLNATLDTLNLMNTYTASAMGDFASTLARLEALGIAVNGEEASQLRDLTLAVPSRVREAIETLKALEAAGVENPAQLGEELRLLGGLYGANALTSETVNLAISNGELETLLRDSLIVRRPGDNILIGLGDGSNTTGQLLDSQNQPVYYLRFGDNTALFVPALLNASILKSIPYIIIGVAVGLGFAAGVFNIGAEGQLHIGALAAAWIGVALIGIPGIIHVPAVLIAGMIGGLLWGSIPGLLKAFTGASEVVVTIMMNFIAALLIDWIIKQDPPILRDPASSVPRTPPIELSAHLPTFSQLPFWFFLLLGGIVCALVLITQRQRSGRALLRPIALGIFTVIVSLFIQFINVPDRIHIGFFIVFMVVFGADWFLMRTTFGFELRTVGMNQSAARYAGMSVALNVVLAMAISGMLAGLAGAIEVSGREFAMVPGLFLGYGFDSISVALLARKNPRSMLWSGFLWGGLLSAAGLMQIRADVSIDLVKIIQALIIMFVAADQIIRFIYRIPKTTDESKLIFSAK